MSRLLCLILGILSIQAAPVARRPNVIMMVLDDIGWADVSFHGGEFPTPNIDNLARTGVELSRYYVQPVCSPTRSAIMTGRYPHRTGMQHFGTIAPGSTAALPTDIPTMAEVYHHAGYSTHAIGKWHLGYSSWEHTPTGRGFDSYTGYMQGQCDYYNKTVAAKAHTGYDFWQNRSADWSADGVYSLQQYTQAAEEVVQWHLARPEQPFFLYYAHQQLHIPLDAPPVSYGVLERCMHVSTTQNRNVLCQMMVALDDSIGQFVQMLKQTGVWDDVLLWVTTDNGGMTQFQQNFPASASSNYPLRAGKATLFEGGVRGVAFVNGGDNLLASTARGTVSADLMHAVDVFPTILEATGLDVPEGVDGIGMWEVLLHGKAGARTEIPLNVLVDCKLCKIDGKVFQRSNYSAIILGEMKLIAGYVGPYDGWWSARNYTWIHADAADTKQLLHLYNLTADPREEHNLAAEQPAVLQRLMERLDYYASSAHGYEAPQPDLPHPLALPALHNGTWSPFR